MKKPVLIFASIQRKSSLRYSGCIRLKRHICSGSRRTGFIFVIWGDMPITVAAAAHPNLALVKYWGQLDYGINIPANNSISVNLSGAKTVTSVTFDATSGQDQIIINGQPADRLTQQRVSGHLDRVRALAGIDVCALVKSVNDFPVSVGFASSASAYAALSLAASRAAGLVLSERELSILARKGSGSACRSIPGGYVEWYAGFDDATSYAASLAPCDYWDITIVSVLMSKIPKKVSSMEGHAAVPSSPYAGLRPAQVAESMRTIREGLRLRDMSVLGMEVEREAIAFSAIAMTSRLEAYPWFSGIYYWDTGTMSLVQAIQQWRFAGLPVYFTLDAGPTMHLICERQQLEDVRQSLYHEFPEYYPDIITSYPGRGAWIIDEENL
ncbi:MAG: diphosphomevalonate decarboxylase [Anaerolineales bacterium]|nr:MAG: diphosphomevalonate decarboxylase [Anaerolineales bacterium]